jgi:hypothetical protein
MLTALVVDRVAGAGEANIASLQKMDLAVLNHVVAYICRKALTGIKPVQI